MTDLLKYKIRCKVTEMKNVIEYYNDADENYCINKNKAISKACEKLLVFSKAIKEHKYEDLFTEREEIRYTVAYIRDRHKEQKANYLDIKIWNDLVSKYKHLSICPFERIATGARYLHVYEKDREYFKIVL